MSHAPRWRNSGARCLGSRRSGNRRRAAPQSLHDHRGRHGLSTRRWAGSDQGDARGIPQLEVDSTYMFQEAATYVLLHRMQDIHAFSPACQANMQIGRVVFGDSLCLSVRIGHSQPVLQLHLFHKQTQAWLKKLSRRNFQHPGVAKGAFRPVVLATVSEFLRLEGFIEVSAFFFSRSVYCPLPPKKRWMMMLPA